MAFKAKVKIDLRFPKLNLQKPLRDIADKVIIPDIQGRMDDEKDISGKSYRELAKSTIRRKQKMGLRTEILHATGQLRRSFKSKNYKKTAVKIMPHGNRYTTGNERSITNKQLADILQNQGVNAKAGKRYFEFFGISDEAEKEAMDFMNKYIKRDIQRGRRRIVR